MSLATPLLADAERRQKLNAQKPQNYSWNYQYGRRYASKELGSYFLPSDDREIKRLNEQDWTFTKAKDGKLFNAPIDPDSCGFKILDIGCGSGIWCMQMAERFPNSHVVGMDISPIQPKEKPSNVVWVLQNVESEWPFPKAYFDFVRLSLLNGSFQDFGSVMEVIVQHLKPGGSVEHQEYSLGTGYFVDDENKAIPLPSEIDDMPPFPRWCRLMETAAERRGRSLKLATDSQSYLSSAGLQDITETIYNLPIGTWPPDEKQKLIGSYMLLNGTQGLDGLSTMMFTQALGWSLESTKAFVEKVKAQIRDDSVHKFLDLYVVYGKKPSLD